jgi:hypothetical protein
MVMCRRGANISLILLSLTCSSMCSLRSGGRGREIPIKNKYLSKEIDMMITTYVHWKRYIENKGRGELKFQQSWFHCIKE